MISILKINDNLVNKGEDWSFAITFMMCYNIDGDQNELL